eukprot:1192678-Prorocentrum_minimum.AAC.1
MPSQKLQKGTVRSYRKVQTISDSAHTHTMASTFGGTNGEIVSTYEPRNEGSLIRLLRLSQQARKVWLTLCFIGCERSVQTAGRKLGFEEKARVNRDGSFVVLAPRAPEGECLGGPEGV